MNTSKIVRTCLLSMVFTFNVVVNYVHAQQERLFKSKIIQCDATSETTEQTGISQLILDYKFGNAGFFVTYKDYNIVGCRNAYFYAGKNWWSTPITPKYNSDGVVTDIISEQLLYLKTGINQKYSIFFNFNKNEEKLYVKLNAIINKPEESIDCSNIFLIKEFYRNEIEIEKTTGTSNLTFKNCKVTER
ncbi:MAG: hypothetical protein QE271_01020 [Bacteriovoracaceae bacterium]|nr:hypothetical protein [Bacteriovoracaceae bacterium]